MKLVKITVRQSGMYPGLLSVCERKTLSTTTLRRALVREGFKVGEAAVIVDEESLAELQRLADRVREVVP